MFSPPGACSLHLELVLFRNSSETLPRLSLFSELVNDQINMLNISVAKRGNTFFLPTTLIKVLHREDKRTQLSYTRHKEVLTLVFKGVLPSYIQA